MSGDPLQEVFERGRMYRVREIAQKLGVARQYASRLVGDIRAAGFQVVRIGTDRQRSTPFVPGGSILDFLNARAARMETQEERECRRARRIGRELAERMQ